MVKIISLASPNAQKSDRHAQKTARQAGPGKGELGAPGTDISSGVISEDFNTDLQFDQSIRIYEQMRKSDAQVQASLKAIKLPLLTANWIVEIDEDGNEEHKEFIEDELFNKLEIPFEQFISEALAYLDFGFYYFEKVFKVRADGLIGWRKFAPRIPSAHLWWRTDEGKGSGKHKNEGITQQLKATDPNKPEQQLNPQIPMDKLLLFVRDQEGDNFEGVSVLRTSYKHWKMKDETYGIQLIAIERHGVGIPVMKIPSNAGDTDRDKAEEFLKNLRSNEKSFLVINNDWEFEIASQKTDSKGISVNDAINHHNRMILMNVLAPFLDLGSGNSGSFALGETQLNFFLNSLQNIAKYMAGVINAGIEELININFGEQESYPKLRATEIGNIDKAALMNAIKAGVDAGLIRVDQKLRDWTRENLNLPDEDTEALDAEEAIAKVEPPPDVPPEKPVRSEKKIDEKKEKQIADPSKKKRDNLASQKRTLTLATKPRTKVSRRESVFQNSINAEEHALEKWWKDKYLPEIEKTEADISKMLDKGYRRAQTEMLNGVTVISTRGNKQLQTNMSHGIDKRMAKLFNKFKQEDFARALMKDSATRAVKALEDMQAVQKFQDIIIDAASLVGFARGHLSNVRGFIFNEGRKITERLIDNFTQKTSLRLILEQTKNIKMNRNITKLSIITHPRAAYRNIITDNVARDGFGRFKPLIPDFKFQELNPAGVTAGILFGIFTIQQLNEKGNTDQNANVTGGMGTHHNDFSYYYPIDEDNFDGEEEIAKEQRKQFNQSVK